MDDSQRRGYTGRRAARVRNREDEEAERGNWKLRIEKQKQRGKALPLNPRPPHQQQNTREGASTSRLLIG